MGLFTRYTTIAESGLLEGHTDCHCHILPGVDDGFRTMEDSLSALAKYEKAGIRSAILTPHIMEDIPNRTAALRQRFTDLTLAWRGNVKLALASENMMDSLFADRLGAGDLLPLPGRFLLVETSYYNPPMNLVGVLDSVKAHGYYPLLAHPERYMYMDMFDYRELKSKDVLFQLNISALVGAYGEEVRAKAEKLLKDGMYDCFGTDLHRESSFDHLLSARIPCKEAVLLEEMPLKFQ